MLLHAARRGTTASLVARQRAATRSLVSGTAGTQKKRPLNVGQLKGNQTTAPPASAGASKAAAPPKPDPPAATSAASKPDAGSAAATAAGGTGAKAAASGGGGGGGLLIGFLGLGAAGVGAAYYYDMIDFNSLTGSPIKEEKKWEIIKQAKEDAEEAKRMEAVAKKEMEEAAGAAASATDAAGEAPKDDKADTAAADAEVSSETKTEEADKVAAANDADSGVGAESSEASTSADGGNRVTTIVVPPIDEVNRPPQVVPANPEHPPNANKVTGLPFGGDAAAGGGGSGSAEESAQREHALVSAEEAAKEIASAAEGETEAKLRAAHKSLRADLDESYLADLDSLGERELRIRVVQLASEMDERTKWEAVRLKEFLSMKEKETAEK